MGKVGSRKLNTLLESAMNTPNNDLSSLTSPPESEIELDEAAADLPRERLSNPTRETFTIVKDLKSAGPITRTDSAKLLKSPKSKGLTASPRRLKTPNSRDLTTASPRNLESAGSNLESAGSDSETSRSKNLRASSKATSSKSAALKYSNADLTSLDLYTASTPKRSVNETLSETVETLDQVNREVGNRKSTKRSYCELSTSSPRNSPFSSSNSNVSNMKNEFRTSKTNPTKSDDFRPFKTNIETNNEFIVSKTNMAERNRFKASKHTAELSDFIKSQSVSIYDNLSFKEFYTLDSNLRETLCQANFDRNHKFNLPRVPKKAIKSSFFKCFLHWILEYKYVNFVPDIHIVSHMIEIEILDINLDNILKDRLELFFKRGQPVNWTKMFDLVNFLSYSDESIDLYIYCKNLCESMESHITKLLRLDLKFESIKYGIPLSAHFKVFKLLWKHFTPAMEFILTTKYPSLLDIKSLNEKEWAAKSKSTEFYNPIVKDSQEFFCSLLFWYKTMVDQTSIALHDT